MPDPVPSNSAVNAARPPLSASRLEVWRNPADGLEYVHIPAGSFFMGASPGDRDAGEPEKPRHRVLITRALWMCRTPVTVGAFRRFCEATRREMRDAPEFNPGWEKRQHPMVNVNWHDAVAYCRWLGGWLPTEAEWEYAARAGGESRFWWGPEFDAANVWFSGNSGRQTHQVGLKPANPWGLQDVLGNVWEWCHDCYGEDYYRCSAPEDPQGPTPGSNKLLRGGSWDSVPPNLRVSYRMRYGPALLTPFIGFRAALRSGA